mmetsp:Transcript_2299/g.2675  ORF Transcript_2299/g.2675 Transcript_2299/m.2675 type:complete len:357 (-) Transcript_2299:159-1229(-)|eukprot:CAMPEP_0194364236 /NCGR_PEP_ID=MMETSP0174-20130528/12156_1 /TAXON_ID=216777 /ORGANISM="Proboscia alata, Strain PI-D3" /LENGTH=356 /DNA_ID=CAMNT_0039138161 /DNA_START=11 /DNA_END=1081 /DNA_ORIENTATION=-
MEETRDAESLENKRDQKIKEYVSPTRVAGMNHPSTKDTQVTLRNLNELGLGSKDVNEPKPDSVSNNQEFSEKDVTSKSSSNCTSSSSGSFSRRKWIGGVLILIFSGLIVFLVILLTPENEPSKILPVGSINAPSTPPIDAPSLPPSKKPNQSIGSNENNEREDQICISIESESPPPSPCIECIVGDAFNKKRRILSPTTIFHRNVQADESEEPTTVGTFLEYLKENGNAMIANITSISVNITQPATYEASCAEIGPNKNLCLFKPETCPSRNVPDVENPDQCEETARLNVVMLADNWGFTGKMDDYTNRLYEQLCLEFLQIELNRLCNFGECADDSDGDIPLVNITDVKIIEDCRL